MKAPKFITAMAIAAVLSSGVAPAYAANFAPDAGNGSSGQTPMQSVNHFDGTNLAPGTSVPQMDAQGDIEVSGEFTKTINNFPTPDQNGRYLRVSMPIKMDFKYDVDKDQLISSESTIVNSSVYVEGIGTSQVVEESQPISMEFVSLEENGTGNSNTINTEFVDKTTNKGQNVELPFKLSVTNAGNSVQDYNLTRIKDNKTTQSIPAINIQKDGVLKLQLKNIDGQVVGNKNLITDKISLTSHNLKLKFEYKGR